MWLYNGTEFNPSYDEIDQYGFVYQITCNVTGQKYIGKKFFHSKFTRPPLKGKTRKRHCKKESDWRDYWGSSKYLHAEIEKYGEKNFTREIISLHPNKAETNYHELKLQIILDVLESRDENGERIYLNENIERRYYPSGRPEISGERINLQEQYLQLRS